MLELLGFLLLAWLVVCGFMVNLAMLLHWKNTGVSPARVLRRAVRYGPQSAELLDELEQRDEEDTKQ